MRRKKFLLPESMSVGSGIFCRVEQSQEWELALLIFRRERFRENPWVSRRGQRRPVPTGADRYRSAREPACAPCVLLTATLYFRSEPVGECALAQASTGGGSGLTKGVYSAYV